MRNTRLGWISVSLGVLATVLVASCTDDPAAPPAPVTGHFGLAPRFANSAARLVDIDRVRVVVARTADEEIVVDTTASVALDADSVDLTIPVIMQDAEETFLLTISLITPAGDTAFTAGPLSVTPGTAGGEVPVVDVPFEYVGVGANATEVAIATVPTQPVLAGDTVRLEALAHDAQGQLIPGTPFEWRSLDTGIVTVPEPDEGTVVAGTRRGTGRIVARTPTGLGDTVQIAVTLPPAQIAAAAGNDQTAPVATLLPQPIVARVTASDGLGVPGVRVGFTVTTGDGGVSADTVVTDSTGRASVEWTLGPNVGTQTVRAQTPSLSGASATFTATGTVSGVGAVLIEDGDGQVALVGTVVPVTPTVRVVDDEQNPVPGAEVTFSITSGGGGATGTIQTTDTMGLAAVGSWTLGAIVGTNTLTATVDTLSPAVFTALAVGPNGAFGMTIQDGDGQTAPVGTVLPTSPAVAVTDTAGLPAEGVPVAFTVTSGGGAASADTVLTDTAGVATADWTLGAAAGANTLEAEVLGIAPLIFTATATVGAPDTVLIVSGDGQTADAGTQLTDPLVIEVQDSLGNPVPDVSVTWATLAGALAPTMSTTDAAGRTQADWTLGTNTVAQTATAAVTDVAPAVFTATANFPNPTILLALESGSDRIVSGGSDTLAITLTAPVADSSGLVVSVTSDNDAVISVAAPGTVTIPLDSTTGRIGLDAPGGGTTTIRATALDYVDGALAVNASVQVLAMPPTLNVPLGGTASVPLQISAPAPAGGVEVTLSSDDPAAVSVQTPTVTIPEGSQTANATVRGEAPGPATITGTTAEFGNAQSVITTTASLNITANSARINGSFGTTLTVRLESAGIPIAAPAPGVTVALVSSDPTCVAAQSPVTIPTGLVDTTFTIEYGGSATLACAATVEASATDILPDTADVDVDPVPGISATATLETGGGLQRFGSGGLLTGNHPGVDLVIRSTDPAVALVAPNPSTPGGDSIVIAIAAGFTGFTFYAQGVEGQTGAADFVISATGFNPDTTAVTVVQPALDVIGVNPSTTSFTSPDVFQARLGVPNGDSSALSVELTRNPGLSPLTVTLVLTDSTAAELETASDTAGTATVEIAAEGSRSPGSVATGGIQLAPRMAGTTTVSGSIPGYIATDNASRTVTIASPGISATALIETGTGLQRFGSGGLGASNHPGVDLVIRSTDPAVALVAPDGATPGSDSIVIPIASGFTGFSFFAQGVEGQTGAADFVITATGFTPETTAVTVVQPALDIIGVNLSTTSFTSPDAFQARLGVPNADSSFLSAELTRNPGLSPLTVTLVLTDSTAAELETATDTAGTATVEIAAEQSRSPGSVATGGIQLAPRTAGTTTVSGSIPGYVSTGAASRTVTITAPGIVVSQVLETGGGLQRFSSGGLGASDHPGVDVVIRSTNPAVALVAPDAATPGSDSIVIPIASGFTGFSFFAQGVDGQTGTADFVVTATGFTSDTTAVTVVEPAIDLIGLNTSITTLSPNDAFQARIGVPSADSTGLTAELTRNPDLPPLTVTLTSGTPSVGELVTQAFTGSSVTVEIAPQGSRSPGSVATGGAEFQPVTAGMTDVSASAPGYVTTTGGGIRTVTVSTPSVNLSSTATGAGLQRFVTGSLGASSHGDVDVVVRSSNFGVLRLTTDPDSAGQDSIVIFVPDGSQGFSYFVQGQDGQTGTVSVTATADGFTDGASSVDVVAPAVEIIGISTQTAGGGDDVFQARSGLPNAGQTGLSAELARNGGAAPLTVSVTSDTPSVGTLVFMAGAADSGLVEIAPATSRSPGGVSIGGVAFRPLTEGTTTVSLDITGFIILPNGSLLITVNP